MMLQEISIEITRKCPSHCVHCSSLSDDKSFEMMEYGKFVSIVRSAADLGVKTICLSGGEPFMHPDIISMIRATNSLGLKPYVYTSGVISNAQNVFKSLDFDLLKPIAGLVTKLIFNIEAAESDTYNKIMGTEGCFEKMKQSVRNANSLHIVTEAHFVPMKLNIRDIESTIELCAELGISKLSFLRLVLHGRALENKHLIALSEEELLSVKTQLQRINERPDIEIRIGVPLLSDLSSHKCEAACGKLNIRYDGRVYPCEVFKNDMAPTLVSLKPESIYDHSLHDIYYNSDYLRAVRDLSKDFTCNNYETCIGQYLINKNQEAILCEQ